MKYIRLYENQEDYLAAQQAAGGDGSYVVTTRPGFAYVRGNYPGSKYAFYNNPQSPVNEG